MPRLGAVAGGALAAVDLGVEDRVTLPREWSYSAPTASSLLTTVSGAMVGLLGLVVTIGVLVVQMAERGRDRVGAGPGGHPGGPRCHRRPGPAGAVPATQMINHLGAVLADVLDRSVLPVNRPAVRRQLEILDETVRLNFEAGDEQAFARRKDRQGIGGRSRTQAGRHAPREP